MLNTALLAATVSKTLQLEYMQRVKHTLFTTTYDSDGNPSVVQEMVPGKLDPNFADSVGAAVAEVIIHFMTYGETTAIVNADGAGGHVVGMASGFMGSAIK